MATHALRREIPRRYVYLEHRSMALPPQPSEPSAFRALIGRALTALSFHSLQTQAEPSIERQLKPRSRPRCPPAGAAAAPAAAALGSGPPRGVGGRAAQLLHGRIITGGRRRRPRPCSWSAASS